MASAKDRWAILNNIIAKAGGIENVNLHSELAKSEAVLNMHKANTDMSALQSSTPPLSSTPTPPQSQNSLGDTANPLSTQPMSPEMGQSTNGQPPM